MQSPVTMEQLAGARGLPVYSQEGEKIGKVEEIFYDIDTNQPEWIGLGTGGFFGTKRALVPTAGASLAGDSVTVPYSKDQVKNSPDIDADEISQETEQELYTYYGLSYSEAPSASGLPEGAPTTETTPTAVETGGTVTRAEEELRVGKRSVEAGRVRLRKWVETEPVQADVEVTRETARVTREPVEQPVSEAELGEAEVEVPLRTEEPMVQKEVVGKERISVEKDLETRPETVTGEVRKERVEVEGEGVEETER